MRDYSLPFPSVNKNRIVYLLRLLFFFPISHFVTQQSKEQQRMSRSQSRSSTVQEDGVFYRRGSSPTTEYRVVASPSAVDYVSPSRTVEYRTVEAPMRVEYRTVEAPARIEYRTVEAPARIEYRTIEAPPVVEYRTVEYEERSPYRTVEYRTVEAPARVEYRTVEAPPVVEYRTVEYEERSPTRTVEYRTVDAPAARVEYRSVQYDEPPRRSASRVMVEESPVPVYRTVVRNSVDRDAYIERSSSDARYVRVSQPRQW